MESRYGGESSGGYSYGESRGYYGESRRYYGESRGYYGESRSGFNNSQVTTSGNEDLKAQLQALQEEIAQEKARQEREEAAYLQGEISKAKNELAALKRRGQYRRK